ncbi:helix-turn-helix domain-containing protein [Mangrovimonas xylaniphaga]|uniref:helix-turn-helix domain-containing protein n=1 Tax=Mangrovimonas xylaniphaga TaxID=1645915 RepID=UPI0006B563CF|nr:helix-turn-helix transcriptional regulator [Mangrovimonas xylaniphaga]
MKLGEIIGKLIKKKGLTQKEVAHKIGKSTTALSQMINDVYEPNPETLDKICEVLDVPKPILHFMMISEEDIPEEKKEIYRILEPTIKEFIFSVFGSNQTEILK